MEHLVAHGHRRIGFLGDLPDYWTARRRREAFVDILASLDLPGEPRVAMGPHSDASLSTMLASWCRGRDPVTAVITGNNRVTLAVLHALRRADLRLGLVGYDDFELADLVDPPVTVVHQDPSALGQKAAQQLFGRLLGDESPPQTVVMPTRLIVRSSGRVPASGRVRRAAGPLQGPSTVPSAATTALVARANGQRSTSSVLRGTSLLRIRRTVSGSYSIASGRRAIPRRRPPYSAMLRPQRRWISSSLDRRGATTHVRSRAWPSHRQSSVLLHGACAIGHRRHPLTRIGPSQSPGRPPPFGPNPRRGPGPAPTVRSWTLR